MTEQTYYRWGELATRASTGANTDLDRHFHRRLGCFIQCLFLRWSYVSNSGVLFRSLVALDWVSLDHPGFNGEVYNTLDCLNV